MALKTLVGEHILRTKCFFFHFDPRSDGNGEVKAVQTFKNTLYSKKAVIVAAGCWTGCLIQDLFRNWGMELHVPVRPRKVCLRNLSLSILLPHSSIIKKIIFNQVWIFSFGVRRILLLHFYLLSFFLFFHHSLHPQGLVL